MLRVTQDRTGAAEALADGETQPDEYLRFGDGPVRDRARDRHRPPARGPRRPHQHRRSSPAAPSTTASPSALFVPVAWGGEVRHVLIVALDRSGARSRPTTSTTAELIADQAAAGFARLEADERRAAGSVQDRAVVRAAARAQRLARPAGDPAHARPRGGAGARRRDERRLPRRRRARRRGDRRLQRARGLARPARRARRGRRRPGAGDRRAVRQQRLPARRRRRR